MMPMMAGLAACSRPLVHLLLGNEWMPSVPFMQVFCVIYAFYPLHTANLNAIKAMGRSDIFLKLELIKKIVETATLIFTVRYGVFAMALGQLFCDILAQLINAWPNKKLLDYPYLTQLSDTAPCILLSLLMSACVLSVILFGLYDLVTLIIQVPLGVVIYVAGARLLKIDSMNYILDALKGLLQRRKEHA